MLGRSRFLDLIYFWHTLITNRRGWPVHAPWRSRIAQLPPPPLSSMASSSPRRSRLRGWQRCPSPRQLVHVARVLQGRSHSTAAGCAPPADLVWCREHRLLVLVVRATGNAVVIRWCGRGTIRLSEGAMMFLEKRYQAQANKLP